ncbi:hypothetical protein [Solemya velum gill symbiont]|nr:hypothetical protein [Solemya velum gill symbiont]
MKKIALSLLGASMIASSTVTADPAAFIGVAYGFSGNFGLTAKVLSSDEEDTGVAALGATYYFGTPTPWGVDLSAGYACDNSAFLLGYDFLQKTVTGSAGWADTEDEDSSYSPPRD